jgi:Domain of unknown function (DUF1772)
MVFGALALTVAALFAGAAIYVSFVEHPARAELDDRAQLQQWKPAYARGAVMQASLALIGSVLGAASWWSLHDWRWLAGAVLLLAAWPYTLLLIMPTNNALKKLSLAEAGPASRALLSRWGRLHLGRTALGVLATALFLAATTAS